MTATGSGLNTRDDSWQHRRFSLRQAIGRIRGETAGVSNVRCDTRARNGVAERHVTNVIDRKRAHETVHAVEAVIENLFLDRRGADVSTSYVNLRPLNASRSRCWSERTCWSGRVIDPERFDTVDVAILILHHRAVGERVGVIAPGRCWHRVSSRNIRALADVYRANKCRTSRSCVVGMKRKNVPRVRRG